MSKIFSKLYLQFFKKQFLLVFLIIFFVLTLSVFFFIWIFRVGDMILSSIKLQMQTIDIDESFFDLWNCEKKQLNKSKRIVYPKPKEIWYIKIGVNV